MTSPFEGSPQFTNADEPRKKRAWVPPELIVESSPIRTATNKSLVGYDQAEFHVGPTPDTLSVGPAYVS
jgi:hypothetical protein